MFETNLFGHNNTKWNKNLLWHTSYTLVTNDSCKNMQFYIHCDGAEFQILAENGLLTSWAHSGFEMKAEVNVDLSL